MAGNVGGISRVCMTHCFAGIAFLHCLTPDCWYLVAFDLLWTCQWVVRPSPLLPAWPGPLLPSQPAPGPPPAQYGPPNLSGCSSLGLLPVHPSLLHFPSQPGLLSPAYYTCMLCSAYYTASSKSKKVRGFLATRDSDKQLFLLYHLPLGTQLKTSLKTWTSSHLQTQGRLWRFYPIPASEASGITSSRPRRSLVTMPCIVVSPSFVEWNHLTT